METLNLDKGNVCWLNKASVRNLIWINQNNCDRESALCDCSAEILLDYKSLSEFWRKIVL